jgi:hypothetical protein
MLKKFLQRLGLEIKSRMITEAKLGVACVAKDAVLRMAEYNRIHNLGIFNVSIQGNPAILVGGFNPKECDRHFASGSLHDDWVAFLSYIALVRLGAEVSRKIGNSNDVIDPVQSRLYPEIEEAFRSRWKC